MSDEYTTSPTDDGGAVVPARTIDADADGRPDYSTPRLLRTIAPYAKAVAGFVTPAVTLAIGYVTPASDGGTAITGSEWLTMAAACLATAGFVYAVPNRKA